MISVPGSTRRGIRRAATCSSVAPGSGAKMGIARSRPTSLPGPVAAERKWLSEEQNPDDERDTQAPYAHEPEAHHGADQGTHPVCRVEDPAPRLTQVQEVEGRRHEQDLENAQHEGRPDEQSDEDPEPVAVRNRAEAREHLCAHSRTCVR